HPVNPRARVMQERAERASDVAEALEPADEGFEPAQIPVELKPAEVPAKSPIGFGIQGGSGQEVPAAPHGSAAEAVLPTETVATASPQEAYNEIRARRARAIEARTLGFTGDACPTCQQFKLVHNGTCTKCMSCGA